MKREVTPEGLTSIYPEPTLSARRISHEEHEHGSTEGSKNHDQEGGKKGTSGISEITRQSMAADGSQAVKGRPCPDHASDDLLSKIVPAAGTVHREGDPVKGTKDGNADP